MPRASRLLACLLVAAPLGAQQWLRPDTAGRTNQSIFRQLELPTPNEYRTAAGRPGPKYWQQRVD
nr:hypothetical protein [Gemmatimonadaceae bacterium]